MIRHFLEQFASRSREPPTTTRIPPSIDWDAVLDPDIRHASPALDGAFSDVAGHYGDAVLEPRGYERK